MALLLITPSSALAQASSPPISTVTQTTSVIQVLPANAAGVLLVKTTPEAWTALTQFQLFAEAKPFLEKVPSLFLGFNFAEDLQPWLGDRAAIALMPATGSEDDRETDHSLLITSVKDASQLPAFIEKLKASRKTTPTEREYRGVTILEWPAPAPIPCGSADESGQDCSTEPGTTPEESTPDSPQTPDTPQAPDSNAPTPIESRQPLVNVLSALSVSKLKAASPTTPSLPIPLPETVPMPPMPSGSQGLAIAVLPGYLVTATTGQAIEQLLESQGQQPTLDQSPLFQRTMQQPQFERSLVVGYANLEELARFPKPKPSEIAPAPDTENPEAPDAEGENSVAESTNSDATAEAEATIEEAATTPDAARADAATPEAATPEANTTETTTAETTETETPVDEPDVNTDTPESTDSTEPSDSTATPTSPEETVFDSVQTLAKDYSVVDGYLWLQPEGIRSQLNSYYKTPQPEKADVLTPKADQILTQIPGASYLTSSSRNLKQQWQEVVTAFGSEPTLNSAIALIRSSVQGITGLDLEKDWLAWMDGEYAAFLFPTNQGPLSQLYPKLNLGLGFVVQTSDRKAAETTLQKFDQFVSRQSQGSIAIAKQTIAGQPVTSWEVEDAGKRQSFFAHGWVNNDTLVVTSGFGPMTTLNPKPYLPLSENYTFKTATGSFPRPNQGYFYTNLGSSLAFLYGVFQPYSDAPELRDVKRWLGTIYSISASNSATPERQQFDSLLVLAPAR